MEINKIYNEDCLIGMKNIDDKSIDMMLCDLPFEITENEWDKIIPTVPLFNQINRVVKDNGAIILMSAGLYTAELMMGNKKYFRYCYVWKTKEKRNFLNASRMPLRQHIDIPVFYKKLPTYNPQKTTGHAPMHTYKKHKSDGSNYGKTMIGIAGGGNTDRHPTTIIDIPYKTITERYHPTQKPVEICEYIIKTYSNDNDLILDFCIGSGTTAVAAINTNRNFIGFEKDIDIYNKACKRIEDHKNKIKQINNFEQLVLN